MGEGNHVSVIRPEESRRDTRSEKGEVRKRIDKKEKETKPRPERILGKKSSVTTNDTGERGY